MGLEPQAIQTAGIRVCVPVRISTLVVNVRIKESPLAGAVKLQLFAVFPALAKRVPWWQDQRGAWGACDGARGRQKLGHRLTALTLSLVGC